MYYGCFVRKKLLHLFSVRGVSVSLVLKLCLNCPSVAVLYFLTSFLSSSFFCETSGKTFVELRCLIMQNVSTLSSCVKIHEEVVPLRWDCAQYLNASLSAIVS